MSILFIDDDSEDTELYCEAVSYLNNSDFLADKTEKVQCLTLNTATKPVDFLSSLIELPDYIFMDINMPVMGGEECLRHLKSREQFSQIPIIMFSTVCEDYQVRKFLQLGAHDCIQKPVGFNALVKVFSKYIFQKYL
jgi:CheY-like chemotaxis protein